MTTSEAQEYRSVANQALMAAQYMAYCPAIKDSRYLDAIAKYFTPTDSGLQPLVADIRDYVVNGADKLAFDVFRYCRTQYSENYRLINAWFAGR